MGSTRKTDFQRCSWVSQARYLNITLEAAKSMLIECKKKSESLKSNSLYLGSYYTKRVSEGIESFCIPPPPTAIVNKDDIWK